MREKDFDGTLKISFLRKIFLSVIFLIIFLNGFFFVEPASVEYVLIFSIPFFLIFGKITFFSFVILCFWSLIKFLRRMILVAFGSFGRKI